MIGASKCRVVRTGSRSPRADRQRRRHVRCNGDDLVATGQRYPRSRGFIIPTVAPVALDRAIALAGKLGAEDRLEGWQRTVDDIHAAVLRHGWSQRAGAFTQYYRSDDLDASGLMMPIVGFLPATDPRVRATVNAIAERLTDERGLVYRYDTRGGADGLDGRQGTFVLCTFWLAQALALAGQPARARHVFERAITYLNDVGLLAEEVDPPPVSCSATSPRPSATSGSSTPPGPSPRPSAGRQPAPAAYRPRPGLSASAAGFRARPCCPQAGSARGHACYVVPVRRHLRPQAGGLPHTRAADRIDRRALPWIRWPWPGACLSLTASPAVMRPVTIPATLRSVMPGVVAGRGVLPPPWVRATLAVLSEPGSVRTMRSLAASSPALKVARAMRDPGMGYPSGADGERHAGQTPDAGGGALCIYCRTDRFVYWPSAIRLSLAECPGCQRRGPAGQDIAPLNGPAAESSRTTPTARAVSATSRLRHRPHDSARTGTPRP